ncbi:hypothetical protein HBI56_195790 [Parastagonospora nodorum]|uniref:Uncharacterized protein n=1 Tax=Phaeosphaeria nodorum (strain SN15 / ATCC MYA-4574 / FGSC 10173) TaxID=321614 RepID=A0A7U2I4Y7_PHANO|nr:hypothetical protein HBH56_207720 [Parastagonospora nodorum]QRC99567.1 hypothetical protein JI435_413600 [Parastagonospora nodorum SN15]KAH3923542.1 hypothetical protein HBH54_206590 [Parastagonospora nodorum]KAH3941525.1 hypothetical protein HBH53_200240 [Parastagonospora nodorum]KAH3960402.1 hypothetical protein HBH51_191120 [Parastagonospora nodorum]
MNDRIMPFSAHQTRNVFVHSPNPVAGQYRLHSLRGKASRISLRPKTYILGQQAGSRIFSSTPLSFSLSSFHSLLV